MGVAGEELLPSPQDLVFRLMADVVKWSVATGLEIPDEAVGFWQALNANRGWFETLADGKRKIFLPGAVADLLRDTAGWTTPARGSDADPAWTAAAESILGAAHVPLDKARDAGTDVVMPRAMVRRVVALLIYGGGIINATAAGDGDDIAVRLARHYNDIIDDITEQLITTAWIGDDEDLDD